jgi:hypothetical protein
MSDYNINRRVHPNCCDEMRRRQTISLALPDTFYEEGNEEAKPTWEIRGYRPAHIESIRHESHVMKDGHKIDTTTFSDPPEADWPEIGPDDFMHSWGFEPKFCPFCGKDMPEIVLRFNPPEKIVTCSDGGYYCDTCSKRLNECQCYPPQWKWMPYCYYPEFGDDRVCKCGHVYYRHFDPFEEMDLVGCKYCDCHIFEEK